MNLRELLRRRQALRDANQAIIDAPGGEDGAFTDEQRDELDGRQAEIVTLNGDITRVRAQNADDLALGDDETQAGNDTTDALEGDGDGDDDDQGGGRARNDNELDGWTPPRLHVPRVRSTRPARHYAADLNPEFGGPQGWRHVGEFLQHVHQAGTDPTYQADPRLLNSRHARIGFPGDADPANAASGMSAVIPQEGGFLIQSQFSDALLSRAVEASQVWGRADNLPIGTGFDRLIEPYIDETSRKDGERSGGVRVQWRAEAQAADASNPKIAENEVKLEELVGLAFATNRSLQNATALAGIIDQSFRDEFSFVLDDAGYRGNGDGKPLGIITAPATVVIPPEVGQDPGTFVTKNASKMFSRMPPRWRAGAVWFLQVELEPELDQMTIDVGAGGMPAYLPPGGFNDAPFGRLKGLPVIPIEQASAVGEVGDIALVNMGQYRTIDQGGLEVATSMHVRFEEREQAFRFVMMANGQPKQRTQITPANGTLKVSPYITLGERLAP